MGVTPNPPYPHKKFEGPNPIEAEIWHIMSLDHTQPPGIRPPPPNPIGSYQLGVNLTFKSKKSSCSLGVVVGGVSGIRPPPPPPPLNFNLTLSQKSQVVV